MGTVIAYAIGAVIVYLVMLSLGELSVATNPDDFWAAERIYKLPAEAFKPTGNSLVVLVNDRQQNGGILGTPSITYRPEYRLYPDTSISTDDPYRYYRW